MTTVVPLAGGSLEGQVGVVVGIHFPAGVAETPLEVTLEEVDAPPATGSFQLLGEVFSITALDPEQNPVTSFDNPFTIVIHYREEQVDGLNEGTLTLYYWQVSEERWIPIAGVVDREANTLTATLDHLTIFAVLDRPTQRLFLPAIQR